MESKASQITFVEKRDSLTFNEGLDWRRPTASFTSWKVPAVFAIHLVFCFISVLKLSQQNQILNSQSFLRASKEFHNHRRGSRGVTGGTCPPPQDFAMKKEVPAYFLKMPPFSYGKVPSKCRAPKFEMLSTSGALVNNSNRRF